ncbi:MAG TPA: DUF819 family protein, partial [Woeseiaceae bacterium]|nr:DUF819 family protein [Woeseiaceae bacterium]
MNEAFVSSPGGVFGVLCAVAAGWFFVAQVTGWKLFQYLPPLIFIYATPVFLNTFGVIPASSAVYSGLSEYLLPAFIVLMLIKVDVVSATRVMGRGIFVMAMGTAGVVVGALVSYLLVHHWLAPDAWTGFGALAGSWIGGTGNMAAASEMLKTPPEQFGLAVLADNVVYIVWLPLLLASRNIADRFNAWTGVSEDRLRLMDAASEDVLQEERPAETRDVIYLVTIAIAVTWLGTLLAPILFGYTVEIAPAVKSAIKWMDLGVLLSEATWRILVITT